MNAYAVVQGRELASRNSDGSSDPFVEIRIGDQSQKTPVIKCVVFDIRFIHLILCAEKR